MRYLVSKKPFDENMAENRNVVELKKMVFFGIFHLQLMYQLLRRVGLMYHLLRHNKWDVIPSFVQNDLTQNVKMDHKKKFHRSLQTMQLLTMYKCKYIS